MTDKSCIVAAIAFLTVLSPWACAGETANETEDRSAIEAFVREFLRAFENLDMKQFIACFADDATVFFPMPEPPERVQGKQAIQQRFERVFASIRSTAKAGPPFHHLVPEDLSIQMMPGHSAVVSFHLRNEERIARRTLVLTRMNGQWLIIHLHASNAPVAAKSKNHRRIAGSSSFNRQGEILPKRSRVAPAMSSAFDTPLSISARPVLAQIFFTTSAPFSRTIRPRC